MGGLLTLFAPAERADEARISDDASCFAAEGLVLHAKTTAPHIILILNDLRQIVFKNQRLMDLLGDMPDREIFGKRPGELLDCVHSDKTPGGCGTTEFCRKCGAVNAILESQSQKSAAVRECRITNKAGDAHDFRVWATPYVSQGREFTVFSLDDISHEKRRQVLERTFFHDVNNILSVLMGCSEMLATPAENDNHRAFAEDIHLASVRLASEIESHRRLSMAESGGLDVRITGISTGSLLRDVVSVHGSLEQRDDRIVIDIEDADDGEITTDKDLLLRVLGNMLKNALEATSDGETVNLSCSRKGSSSRFCVHNPGHIPRSTQLQLFQRSFSTKGTGRGIGTYSMKLFGERYLKGEVGFTTSEEDGTTFYVVIPNAYSESE